MNLIEQIKTGKGQTAVTEIRKTLGRKLMEALKTERVRIINETYGDGEEIQEAIENPNSSGQGHDPDHIHNPHHATMLKHGYEYSHSTPVNHSAYSVSKSHPDYHKQDIRIHHAYKHKDLKDHVAGVYPDGRGGHKWDVHKLGQGSSFTGSGDAALDKHLKGHVARARKKLTQA